jgi:hypothetical protein
MSGDMTVDGAQSSSFFLHALHSAIRVFTSHHITSHRIASPEKRLIFSAKLSITCLQTFLNKLTVAQQSIFGLCSVVGLNIFLKFVKMFHRQSNASCHG